MTNKDIFIKELKIINKIQNLNWDDNHIYYLATAMEHKIDETRPMLLNEFYDLIEHNYGNPKDYKDMNFNDEIISIEEVGDMELIDIEVSNDNLFYANDILTHNSAYGNTDAGLESVSDSIGLVQTADTFCFLINSDTMKEQNQVLLKFEKNRNTGQLNSLMLEVDYTRMRYTDFYDEDNQASQEELNTMIPEALSENGLDFG